MSNDPSNGAPARKLTAWTMLSLGLGLARAAIPAAKAKRGTNVERLAPTDMLTGLPNRLALIEATGTALRRGGQPLPFCAFLMIDLDRFKSVNDTRGHPIGDLLLQLVADRLKALSSETVMIARLGGDEFGALIRDAVDLAQVEDVAQAVIDRLSAPYTVDNQVLHIGASVGVAVRADADQTVGIMMRNADLALYRAKALGGGQVCRYAPALLAEAQARRRLELALRQAQGRDEFALEFQPVVDARDERIVSFEALLRWHNPALGAIAPGQFMPLAEATRLIVPIGNWVLQRACQQASRWPAHIRVAVNVSGAQLADPNFVDDVVTALAMANLPPQRLEIEVTEGVFLHDATIARDRLEQIMVLGCAVALNHFGTGFSSLGHIHTLRFSTIKLDRSFVQGAAAGNRESLAMLRAVVAMADSLDMGTTAEGVETPSELALARSLGCRRIQGFFYGRPMRAEDAMSLGAATTREAIAVD